MPLPNPTREPVSNPLRRFVWLLVCIAVGLGVAAVGKLLTGSSAWALAVPLAIAIGWLFIADPTRCVPTRPLRSKADRGVDPP
ncbi:MAG: hypothetical protein OEY03_01730 [Rhizobacter sp.]|nr:hypothetical protein [Rhizobacter sp.]